MRSIRFEGRGVVTVVFILVTAASFSYIAVSTLNYMQYWSGVAALSPELREFSVQTDQSSQLVTVLSTVEVGNPSDYSGFSLSSVQLSTFFFDRTDQNKTLFQTPALMGVVTESQPLAAHSAVTASVTIQLTPDQSSSFLLFNQTYPGQVVARVIVHIEVETFLNRVLGKAPIDLVANRTL